MSTNTSSTPARDGAAGGGGGAGVGGAAGGGQVSRLSADIRAFAVALQGVVAGLNPGDLPVSWAPDVLAAFSEVERAAVSGRVLVTARAAAAGVWERERFGSPAEWLAACQGTTSGRARADLETSERLGGLDATADAVRAGLLSPEQAAAVADAAAVNPDAERDLLDVAGRESLGRTRREAERRKAEATSEARKAERDARVRRERRVRCSYRHGAGWFEAVGPVAEIAELEGWINRQVDQRLRNLPADTSRGDREPVAAYRFDALIAATRNTGPGPGPGSDTSGSGGSGGAGGGRVPVRRLTFVRVDLAALRRGSAGPGELCEIGGVCVSVAELRRTLGESMLQLVLTNGDAVVDVVNLGRKPTVAQALAKLFTDSACTVVGCDRAVCLEFDHRDDWARVQVTELANLDLLCGHHHDLKTRERWQLVAGTGRRPMRPPGHPDHPEQANRTQRTPPPGPAPATAPAPVAAVGSSPPGDRSRLAELTARLARIHARETAHRARLAGQSTLFDPG